MNEFLVWVQRISKGFYTIAGIALTGIMLVTVTDVALRFWGRPIVGIFELVAFGGALVIVQKLPRARRKVLHIFTRSLSIALFLMIGWNLWEMGTDLLNSGEVSPTLQMPFYPIVYAIGISCFLQCLVLLGDVFKVIRGQYE
jgi:TRAP-type C4-dicarboxylate transport system permease small subunit